MKRFDITRLKEGDIIAGRNMISKEGEAIRAILGGCISNHNALIIRHNTRGWGIGDMVPPCGVFVPFCHYENMVDRGDYEISVYRIIDATPEERRLMSYHWQEDIDRQPYSRFSMYRLWVMRFANSVPWTIHGTWCTRAVGMVCASVFPQERNIFRKIYVDGMPLKKNETPRTVEKRLVQRLLADVTDDVFKETEI